MRLGAASASMSHSSDALEPPISPPSCVLICLALSVMLQHTVGGRYRQRW
jgi:hypothetical protein